MSAPECSNVNLRNLREELDQKPEFSQSEIFSDATIKAIEKGEHDSQRAKDFELPDEIKNVRLTERDGTKIREDCAVEGYSGKHVSRKLSDCVEAFRRWYLEYEDRFAVFEEHDTGNKKKVPLNNAFSPKYTERYYARFADLERGLKVSYELEDSVITVAEEVKPSVFW